MLKLIFFKFLNKLYTIGIGNSCSRELILNGAKAGNGKSEFITEF